MRCDHGGARGTRRARERGGGAEVARAARAGSGAGGRSGGCGAFTGPLWAGPRLASPLSPILRSLRCSGARGQSGARSVGGGCCRRVLPPARPCSGLRPLRWAPSAPPPVIHALCPPHRFRSVPPCEGAATAAFRRAEPGRPRGEGTPPSPAGPRPGALLPVAEDEEKRSGGFGPSSRCSVPAPPAAALPAVGGTCGRSYCALSRGRRCAAGRVRVRSF